jgi:pyruvate dehydrogenase E2 component (dihydrolipoamide acetyltransferase)
MSATEVSDHCAVDGADGAQIMAAFKALVGNPLRLVA